VDGEAPAEVEAQMKNPEIVIGPKAILLAGSEILGNVLTPAGFKFQFRGDGVGSGGHFAHGEFVRGNRRLEFHFRHTLGMVTYHVGEAQLGHEDYLRCLGFYEQRHYPDFPKHPLDSFTELSRDLREFCSDFVSGDASKLLSCASRKKE
jgi:hypothetical protein